MTVRQPALRTDLPAVPNNGGLAWTCPDCLSLSHGRIGLVWQPPDYVVGLCAWCRREFRFASRWGQDELEAETGSDLRTTKPKGETK